MIEFGDDGISRIRTLRAHQRDSLPNFPPSWRAGEGNFVFHNSI